MDKDLATFFRQAKEVRLHGSEKEAMRPHPAGDSVRDGAAECQNEHMTWSFDRFLTASQTLRLTDRERSESFARIAAFMEEHPVVPMAEGRSLGAPGIFSREAWASLFSSLRLMPALALALLLLIGSGAATVAAESALPGDALYAVKINVNEAFRKAVAVSPEAEARVEANLAERRLVEARELAAKGAISAEVQQDVAAAIERQVSVAREKIVVLAGADAELGAAADVSTELDAAVRAHRKVFTRLSESDGPSVTVILSALAQADDASLQAQTDLQTKLSAASSDAFKAVAEQGIAAAQRQTDSVRDMLERQKEGLTAQARGEMEARLKSAQDAIAQARARFEAGDNGQAMSIAAEANAAAHEGRALSTVQKLLVEVKANGGNANVEITTDGTDLPVVNVQGGNTARVRINGKDVTSSAAAGVSSASSLGSSRSSSSRADTQTNTTNTSVTVNQQTTSNGTTTTNTETNVDTTTNVNTSTNVNIQGGGSVQIHQSAGVKVNNTVNIGD